MTVAQLRLATLSAAVAYIYATAHMLEALSERVTGHWAAPVSIWNDAQKVRRHMHTLVAKSGVSLSEDWVC